MNRIENIFGDEIEKTVFISDEQLHDKNAKALYGKFYEDTNIYNIFPAQLSDQGEYLCDVLEQTDTPETAGLCAIFSDEQLEFFMMGKSSKSSRMGFIRASFPVIRAYWKQIEWLKKSRYFRMWVCWKPGRYGACTRWCQLFSAL